MDEDGKQPKNFLDILVTEVPYEYKLKKYKVLDKSAEPMDYEIDDAYLFRNTVYVFKNKLKETKHADNEETRYSLEYKREDCQLKALDLIPWEKNIIYDDANGKRPINIETREYVNKIFESNWEENIWYENPPPKKPMILYIDDPNLIFEPIKQGTIFKKKTQKLGNIENPIKNKYNLSNDRFYDTETKDTGKLMSLGIQHSIPALRLVDSIYRINFSMEELNNWHRPECKLEFLVYQFSKPMQITQKANLIKKLYEISCNDLSEFVICEYAEEKPIFITKPGMVNIITKYYRKADENDESLPKDHNILEYDDQNSFFGMDLVPNGEKREIFDCNLFTSPVFQHQIRDYLLIKNETKLIFRKIPKIYLMGQELPKEEVFAPHSRRLNQFCRDRLKIHCHRNFIKNKNVTIEELNKAFPNFTEGSKRKWIKEYAELGKLNGENVFIPKDDVMIYKEEELRKLISPENICQYESMLVDENRMESLGYKILGSNLDDNDFIPNWILSRNFINSANGKGLLEIVGANEPTGMGEGLSFAKKRFKKTNESETRRLFSEHQVIYKQLASDILKKQAISLSSSENIKRPVTKTTPEEKTDEYISEKPVLIIVRYYVNNGVTVEKTEEIYDKRVAKAYLKLKGKLKTEDKKSTIKCSSCGGVGHMKTNKNCPNYQGSAKKKILSKKKPIVKLQEKILKLISSFSNVPFSYPFHRPVSTKKFPTYTQIIQNPIDFSTMKGKCKNGEYINFDMFLEDITLLSSNCLKFNGPLHSLTEMSQEFVTKAHEYKANNFDELFELEKEISDKQQF